MTMFKDVKWDSWGLLDGPQNEPVYDSRSTSATTVLFNIMSKAFTPNILRKVRRFRGRVVHGELQTPAESKFYLGKQTEGKTSQTTEWVYKVWMPTTSGCLGRPKEMGLTKRSESYPDVHVSNTAVGITGEKGDLVRIPDDSEVVVEFNDLGGYEFPMIVEVIGQPPITPEMQAGAAAQGSRNQYRGGGGGDCRGPSSTSPAASAAGRGQGGTGQCKDLVKWNASLEKNITTKGSKWQTGKKLHSNNWTGGWRSNSASDWVLPINPSEPGRNSKKDPTALRVGSTMNRPSTGKNHKAIDISGKTGTPLYAVQDGVVIKSPSNPCHGGSTPRSCGNTLIYETIEGYKVTYCHMDQAPIVVEGQQIKRGQLVGWLGDTGSSTGAHLHWAVRDRGNVLLHPADFYPPEWMRFGDYGKPAAEIYRKSVPDVHTPRRGGSGEASSAASSPVACESGPDSSPSAPSPSESSGPSAGTPTDASPSGLRYNEFRTGAPEYKAIQIHYTVTHNTRNAIAVLRARGLSYHYIIDKDGSVTMTVDPTKAVARHAGRGNPDQTRVGISFVNLGYDEAHAGRHGSLPKEQWETFPGNSLRWEPYTSSQIDAGKQLVRQLTDRFPDIKTIFGHEDTSSGKSDPGPAFDRYWAEYEALLPQGRGSTARSTRNRGVGV